MVLRSHRQESDRCGAEKERSLIQTDRIFWSVRLEGPSSGGCPRDRSCPTQRAQLHLGTIGMLVLKDDFVTMTAVSFRFS